jgi:hypothetical protein
MSAIAYQAASIGRQTMLNRRKGGIVRTWVAIFCLLSMPWIAAPVALARDVVLYCLNGMPGRGGLHFVYIPDDVPPANFCWFTSTLTISNGTRSLNFLCYSKNISSPSQATDATVAIPNNAYPNNSPVPQSVLDRLRQDSAWGSASNAHSCAAAFQ